MNDKYEEEPSVAEAQMHLTDLADLAATDRLLDRLASREPRPADLEDEVAAMLLALALDVDAVGEPNLELDSDLEALLAAWIESEATTGTRADVVPAATLSIRTEPVAVGSDENVDAAAVADEAPATLPLRNRGEGRAAPWTPRRLLLPALRMGVAAAVAVVAVGIGGMVTGDSPSSIPGLSSVLGAEASSEAGEEVEDLIEAARDAVDEGRPRDAVDLFTKALQLVPQLDAKERPTLQKALTELRQVLVSAPGVPPAQVPQVPVVAEGSSGGTGADQSPADGQSSGGGDAVPSPSPVLPTLDPATPTEPTSEPEPTTPAASPTDVPSSSEPTSTDEPSSTNPTSTSVDPQTHGGPETGGTDDGQAADSLTTPEAAQGQDSPDLS